MEKYYYCHKQNTFVHNITDMDKWYYNDTLSKVFTGKNNIFVHDVTGMDKQYYCSNCAKDYNHTRNNIIVYDITDMDKWYYSSNFDKGYTETIIIYLSMILWIWTNSIIAAIVCQ